jgi:hypothetical protein
LSALPAPPDRLRRPPAERLREANVETHLVISRWGGRTLLHETSYSKEQVEALATAVYAPGDMGAAISSGSFKTDGMIIAPCSAKTLAAIAHGYGDNLVHRRGRHPEGAPLVLVLRSPAQRHPPGEHAEAVAHGRHRDAARARTTRCRRRWTTSWTIRWPGC